MRRTPTVSGTPDGPPPNAWRDRWRRAAALLLGGALVYLLLAGAGLLLTRRMADGALVRADRAVSRWFLEHRTPALDRWTHLGSMLSDTNTAIVVTAVAVVVLRLRMHRWREPIAVVVAILGELFIFVLVTATVHRQRPTISHLDGAPPTSSFPSGHTGAAVALYVGLAILLVRPATPRRVRPAVLLGSGMLCLIPVVVGVSRIYRGMHFLTDVLARAVAGGLWLAIVLATVLAVPPQDACWSDQAGRGSVDADRVEATSFSGRTTG
jgi:membrane-associated phospholipid phosphatase